MNIRTIEKDIEVFVEKYFLKNFSVKESMISDRRYSIYQLGDIDSIDIALLTIELEKEYSIEITNEEALSWSTIDDIIKCVFEKYVRYNFL